MVGPDPRAAAALHPPVPGVRADQRDARAVAGSGSSAAVVLQQHHRPRRGAPDDGARSSASSAVTSSVPVVAGAGPLGRARAAGRRRGRGRASLTSPASTRGAQVRRRARAAGPGISRSSPASSDAAALWRAEPVADDDAVEAPLAAQHLGEQPRVLAAVRAVEPVVGRSSSTARRPRRTAASNGTRYSSRSVRSSISDEIVIRSNSVSLPTKCLTQAATPSRLHAPRRRRRRASAVSTGSSLKHSKLRPPIGVRWRLTVGARSTWALFERASRPSARPTSLDERRVPRRAERARRTGTTPTPAPVHDVPAHAGRPVGHPDRRHRRVVERRPCARCRPRRAGPPSGRARGRSSRPNVAGRVVTAATVRRRRYRYGCVTSMTMSMNGSGRTAGGDWRQAMSTVPTPGDRDEFDRDEPERRRAPHELQPHRPRRCSTTITRRSAPSATCSTTSAASPAGPSSTPGRCGPRSSCPSRART